MCSISKDILRYLLNFFAILLSHCELSESLLCTEYISVFLRDSVKNCKKEPIKNGEI